MFFNKFNILVGPTRENLALPDDPDQIFDRHGRA
jgi:hypothetical protein